MENIGLFKSSTSQKKTSASGVGTQMSGTNPFSTSAKKKERSIEDLMISEEDLAIDENNMLETHTLQKISLESLNWNSQFFDYSEEPYLFYLAGSSHASHPVLHHGVNLKRFKVHQEGHWRIKAFLHMLAWDEFDLNG